MNQFSMKARAPFTQHSQGMHVPLTLMETWCCAQSLMKLANKKGNEVGPEIVEDIEREQVNVVSNTQLKVHHSCAVHPPDHLLPQFELIKVRLRVRSANACCRASCCAWHPERAEEGHSPSQRSSKAFPLKAMETYADEVDWLCRTTPSRAWWNFWRRTALTWSSQAQPPHPASGKP